MDAAKPNRHALVFIFVTILVDTIGLGIIIPVTPSIIEHLVGGGMSDAAWWGGWLSFAFASMLFLCSPVMGNLSDRFGRKPVLIASLLALGADYLITGLAPTIWWLFIGRTLSGMAGASYTVANAYIADVTPPEKRSQSFGLVGAAFGLGFAVGPALGGLIGQYGARLPFYVSAALAVCNALYGLLVLKESLPPERRRKFELWRANPVGSLMALKRYPALLGFIAVLVLMRLAHDANPSIWTYYVYLKFHWTPTQVGYSMMFLGIVMALVFGVLTRVMIPRIGEVRCAYLGLTCGAIGFTGYAFATQGWMMYAWIAVWSLMGLAMPSINGIMSRQVAANEQGELQGALASLGGLTAVVAPVLLTNVFSYFTGAKAPFYFPGAAFLVAGLLLALAALMFARIRHDAHTHAPAKKRAV
ncbi:MAG TPA: TCR/Tet family MFS transporter [Rhizomicrobium sp.]|jgi:DHA1 family tetracycline resistance protein-like MFS transporter|nr:TCR/Tet family MFS transporter [Rhizomicrobium sp.]